MAETYEYPPSLNHYRPINFSYGAHVQSNLKLKHHFFLTRVKIVFREVVKFKAIDAAKTDYFLQNEVVSGSCFHDA